MNTRQTWWLVAVALALGLYIVLVEQRSRRGEAGPPSNLLPLDLKQEEVSALEIVQTNQPAIVLTKNGGLWALEAPLHYPAQTYAAERWIRLLLQTKWAVRLSGEDLRSQGAKLSDFGLAPPQITVHLQTGGRKVDVLLGNRLAVGKQFYLQIAGQPDVFVADSQLLEVLPDTVTNWRDPALFPYASIAVGGTITIDQVEVRPATNGYTLQHDPVSRWKIIRPISARGDATRINQFIWRIIPSWQIEAFVTDDPTVDLVPYGLQTPEQELVVGKGTNNLLAVQFGRSPTNRPDLVYARLLRHTNIVLTARTNLDWLRLPAAFWRDQFLIHLETNRVQEIVGWSGATNASYRIRQQTNGSWQLVAPEPLPVDPELVTQFFNLLNSVEVGFEKDVVTDFTPYGLAEAPRRFEFLSLTNGITTNSYPTVSFGTNITGSAFARRADETAVYSINSNLFYNLPLAYWQWRDRQIWEFNTNEIQRVRITQKGKTREVLRTPGGSWELAPGSTGVLDLKFDEAMLQLGTLKADRWIWVGKRELEEGRLGFSSNSVHQIAVVVSQKGVMRTNVVDFGGTSGEGKPYAAVQLGDERTWFFEFPPLLYYQFVKQSLSIPGAGD